MRYSKNYAGCEKLPEVQKLIELFSKRKYQLLWCNEHGLRMQKGFTEIHLLPETDRFRLCIHDDGMGEKETDIALRLGSQALLQYGYRQGKNILDSNGGYEESDDEYYKYFNEKEESNEQ